MKVQESQITFWAKLFVEIPPVGKGLTSGLSQVSWAGCWIEGELDSTHSGKDLQNSS